MTNSLLTFSFLNLQCKKQSHEQNAAQLESERTQVIKGV
jgi:hypothetical protein